MTNVSPHTLEQRESKKLIRHFTHLMGNDTSGSIFSELFTDAEQIMFVKRLAVILMLEKGYSMYRISKTMRVSETTVTRIAEAFETGRYNSLITTYHNYPRVDREDFLRIIETLLRAGLPPRDQHRWKHILKD